MDQVLQQDDTSFLDLLERMADGTLERADVDFIVGKCLDKATENTRQLFAQAIHIFPTWKMAHPIVIAYLNNMVTPVAKINAQYQSILSSGITNHCVKGPLPERLAICVGAKVMLLRNFVVEYKLMNGCFGVVKEIVYKSTSGPANKDELPAYVIVDFPSCTIPLEDALVPNMPPTCVPVPVVMDQCKKNVAL